MARDEINAFLGAGTNYHGKLHFQGAVRIDGNFQGEVVSEGTLVIGQEAVVDGQIKVGQLVLSGRLKGEVEAKNKVVLHKTANLQGNIRTPVLVVEEGAVLEGQLVMGSLDTAAGVTPQKETDQS
ncbi:polymer-forming cytoskeletal protein [Desulfovibrio sp. Huiquan2017]|uniref:bactofilin family protein n=1 Tax=Desulfovibrio sp. Huiquan2017 TaxID=2816861 RepID=UPI001A92F99C|nr:polymer-forming cytoskeletal protein [Desulfovibrio sp. Huiquan2017]